MPADFFDTNVLVYLASKDERKADRAEEVLSQGGTVSVQVLNELANVARRKMGLSWEDTRDLLANLRSVVSVVPLSVQTHESGLALAERYSLSVYDAMILASALEAGCETLWSEDLQHGMRINQGLKIINPFAAA